MIFLDFFHCIGIHRDRKCKKSNILYFSRSSNSHCFKNNSSIVSFLSSAKTYHMAQENSVRKYQAKLGSIHLNLHLSNKPRIAISTDFSRLSRPIFSKTNVVFHSVNFLCRHSIFKCGILPLALGFSESERAKKSNTVYFSRFSSPLLCLILNISVS